MQTRKYRHQASTGQTTLGLLPATRDETAGKNTTHCETNRVKNGRDKSLLKLQAAVPQRNDFTGLEWKSRCQTVPTQIQV